MSKVIDLTGLRFGRLFVKGFSHQIGKRYYWECVCDCGSSKAVWGADLKREMTKSCGCYMRDEASRRTKTHGMTKHPAYQSWRAMRFRCDKKKNVGYPLYGERGIVYCDRWKSFDAFWEDMKDGWEIGKSLDRIDTNGNYEKNNCRWATAKQQADNRRTGRIINTPDGRMSVTNAARKYGLSPLTIFARINYGWPEADLLKPSR